MVLLTQKIRTIERQRNVVASFAFSPLCCFLSDPYSDTIGVDWLQSLNLD